MQFYLVGKECFPCKYLDTIIDTRAATVPGDLKPPTLTLSVNLDSKIEGGFSELKKQFLTIFLPNRQMFRKNDKMIKTST